MMPSVKEIVVNHPYLIPILLLAFVFLLATSVWVCVARVFTPKGNCPGCVEHKQGPCLVACERTSRRLDEIGRG